MLFAILYVNVTFGTTALVLRSLMAMRKAAYLSIPAASRPPERVVTGKIPPMERVVWEKTVWRQIRATHDPKMGNTIFSPPLRQFPSFSGDQFEVLCQRSGRRSAGGGDVGSHYTGDIVM